MTMRKAVKAVLGMVSLFGMMFLLMTIGGIESGMFGIEAGRILGALAMFGAPLGIITLIERR